ncbi:MAG: SDR family NAD(P)-dependent oxidoreductase [Alphaproteobacteria bacterium]|nr:SDR family NAD(P)-dependent oxidoreductase [Alphaproteobacteria bacterium]
MSENTDPVAIVGMACRFPGSPDVNAYWKLLLDGGDAIIQVPPQRWNLDALEVFNDGEPLPYNALHGGWLPRVRDFDHVFFRMSPREARTLDPKQRLSLEVVYEAFEDANLSPGQLRGRQDVGMFLGTAQSEYLMRFYNRMEVSGKKADRYSGPGNDCSFSSGRISAMFGLEGPSINVNTACSTSLVAVHQAVRAIQSRECDIAAAGGVTIIESPEHSLVMNKFGVLSPVSRCKAFDASADGYVRAEGCGMVVLRRLSDAIAAGDRIYAIVTGSAVNHNGLSDNLMAPDTGAQTRLLQAALAVSGTDPAEVDVVEAHGTGTSVGDPIEIHALENVFAAGHAKDRPLYVASVKTNIGHLEVTAGIAGLIKAVLSVHHGQIPRHLHLDTLNPAISPELPFRYPKTTEKWPTVGHPRRAVVNSFGISGINAAVVIEQAPKATVTLPDAVARPTTLLPLTAYGDAPLKTLAAAYAGKLAGGASLAELACTAATGRDQHPSRALVAAPDAATARQALQALADGAEHPALRTADARSTAPRVAFLFTGQGAQYVGMGKALYATEPAYAAALDAVDAAFAPHLGRSITAVMHGDDTTVDLDDTAWTQPGLFAIEYALCALWRSWGVEPDVMVGHSIGELVAATVAGVFSLDDACKLVAARGRLMSALPHDGAMAAIFADADTVRLAISGHKRVDIAADNGPTSVVISGDVEGVEAVCAAFDARDVGTRRLTVSHAFHSALMEPMLDPFREVARSLTMRPPTIPILSNVTGALADAQMATPEYWVRHVRGAVRFREAIEAIAARGVGAMLELGPEATLIGMARRCVRGFKGLWLPSLKAELPHATLLDSVGSLWLGGGMPRWDGFWAHHRTRRIDLPRYPFQRKEHWVDDPGPLPGQASMTGALAATAVPARSGASAPAKGAFDRSAPYRMRWLPCDALQTSAVGPGTWIVGLDASGVGDEIATGLEVAGHTVVRVVPAGTTTARTDVVEVDPTRPDGYRSLAAAHTDLRGWVHTWALDLPERDDAPPGWWAAQQDTGSLASLFIAQALLGVRQTGARMVTVTRGADVVHPGERPHLGQGGAWGVARVVSLEHRGFGNLRVDLDPAGGGADVVTGLLTRFPTNEDQLALRRGRTYALRLTPHTPSGARIQPTPGTAWVITGGLGALGLAVAEWLVAQGCTHVVLCGRSAPKPDAKAAIARMEAAGAKVLVEAVDIGDPTQVANLFRYLDRKVPVRGILHAAGVLADGPVLGMDRERFYKVFGAKVDGAWNLHRATVDRDLDAFVLFSSVTSILGAPGQVNYAAANAFMDALAWRRQADGLPAVSINWGPWGEIGMAARLSELMASRGMGGVKTAEGVDALGATGADLLPQVAFMDMRVHTLMQRDPAFVDAPLVRELVALAQGGKRAAPTPQPASTANAAAPPSPVANTPSAAPAAPPASFVDVVRSKPVGERKAVVAARLAELAEDLLGIERGSLGHSRPLAWQGFDSVMAIDLNEAIARTLGKGVKQEAVTVGPSVDDLADLVLEALALPAQVVPLPAAPAPAAVAPASAPAVVAAEVRFIDQLKATPPAGRKALVASCLAELAEDLLGVERGSLGHGRPLAWQGFDSVMAIDLNEAIARTLGKGVKQEAVTVGPSVDELADLVLEALALPAAVVPLPQAPAPAVPAPTPTPAAAAPSAAAATPLDHLKATPPAQRRAVVTATLAGLAEDLLGVDAGSLGHGRPLAWQGFDSVMALDLNEAIARTYGRGVKQEAVTVGPAVDELADLVLEALALPDTVVPLPTPAAPVHTTTVPAAPAAPRSAPAPAPSPSPPAAASTASVPGWTPPVAAPNEPDLTPPPVPAPGSTPAIAWVLVGVLVTGLLYGAVQMMSGPSDDVSADHPAQQVKKKRGK